LAVLIFLPASEKDLPNNAIEERTSLLKKSLAQTEHSEFAKNFFLVQNGPNGLKNVTKKFGKTMFDLSQTYY